MKKHIIIAGVPRAGKSTVSRLIAQKFGYQHVSMDSVIAGIETVFPETGVNSDAPMPPEEKIRFISSKMGPFLRAMMDSGEYNEQPYGMVIDIYQLLPEDYVKHIDPDICDIYYFLTSDVSVKERFDILKKHDTPDDYTYYESDEDNMARCREIVTISKIMSTDCKIHHLPCLETSRERERVIEEFVSSCLPNV